MSDAMDPDAVQLLTRLEVKVDSLLARDDDHEARLRALEQRAATPPEPPSTHVEKLADHEVRLRGLERWRWLMTGIAAAGGGAIGAAATTLLGG